MSGRERDRRDETKAATPDGATDLASDPERELVGDERMYTGEPVETDDGLRRPQQMAVGADNVEGGGEFPDPHTPPRPPAPGAVDGPDEARGGG